MGNPFSSFLQFLHGEEKTKEVIGFEKDSCVEISLYFCIFITSICDKQTNFLICGFVWIFVVFRSFVIKKQRHSRQLFSFPDRPDAANAIIATAADILMPTKC